MDKQAEETMDRWLKEFENTPLHIETNETELRAMCLKCVMENGKKTYNAEETIRDAQRIYDWVKFGPPSVIPSISNPS